jgi:hypothetical protein
MTKLTQALLLESEVGLELANQLVDTGKRPSLHI